MERIKLSRSFSLAEFTRSQTAARMGRKIEPDTEIIENLRRLCRDVLQPLRQKLGPLHISSGYRPPWLNKKLPGTAKKSQHMLGLAADIYSDRHSAFEIAQHAVFHMDPDLPFDQCIHEFGEWVHISVAPLGQEPRFYPLTAYKLAPLIPGLKPRTRYADGIHLMEALTA